jgi:hypothetical protein
MGQAICDGVDSNGQLKWKKESGFNAMERPQYSMMVKNFAFLENKIKNFFI